MADEKHLAILGQPDPSGGRPLLRIRKDTNGMPEFSLSMMHEVKDGQPLTYGELVELKKCPDSSFYEVTTLMDFGDGPPQVATENYRVGWDRVFGDTGSKMVN